MLSMQSQWNIVTFQTLMPALHICDFAVLKIAEHCWKMHSAQGANLVGCSPKCECWSLMKKSGTGKLQIRDEPLEMPGQG